jgi:hypothetical protein
VGGKSSTVKKLADMNRDELMAFWSRYCRPSRQDAETLVGDRRPMYTIYASRIAALACSLACARDGIKVYENHCRVYLGMIPEDIRTRLELSESMI